MTGKEKTQYIVDVVRQKYDELIVGNEIILDSDMFNSDFVSVFEIIYESRDWNYRPSDFDKPVNGVRDPHPDPKESLEYIQTVLPNLKLTQETIDYANNFKLGDRAPQYYLGNRF